mmetsp:Transcript_12850/g.34604  ORF Transcript_12850/g.34604 Transcript_12850/m.34604 type:complete len:243 (+) Transcript_12850:397-1125(+)
MIDSIPDLTEAERKWLDDRCLLRYLRARDFKLEKAFAMISATLKWRKEFGVVDVMMGDLASVKKESESGKMYVRGKDKHGRPILYMKPRLQNTKQGAEQIRHLVYTLERCVSIMDPGVEKLALVIDFKGFSMFNSPSFAQQKETLTILQDHYPERLGVALCYDAPSLFWGVYKVIKPFIDPVTAEKIQFVKNPVKQGTPTYETLTELVGLDQLETGYGGKNSYSYSNDDYFQERIVPPCVRD